jgi:hypothetical protein
VSARDGVPSVSDSDGTYAYCPFCREGFSDLARCPDHDLQLVTLRELGRFYGSYRERDQRMAWWSPRLSRGWLALGATATLLAFACPFGRLAGDVAVTNTLFRLARAHAIRLWLVPLGATALLLMLYRRRTPAALRGARLAALFVSCLPSYAVATTWLGARSAAHALSVQRAAPIEFHLGFGAWLVWAAGSVLLVASLRLGTHERSRKRVR